MVSAEVSFFTEISLILYCIVFMQRECYVAQHSADINIQAVSLLLFIVKIENGCTYEY